MEEVSLVVGEVVRFESIKSASWMNVAMVIFLEEVRKVEQVVECRVVVRDTFTPVFPLVSPEKNYVVFVISETMKCFGCGAEGHRSLKPDRRLMVWAWISWQRRLVVGWW